MEPCECLRCDVDAAYYKISIEGRVIVLHLIYEVYLSHRSLKDDISDRDAWWCLSRRVDVRDNTYVQRDEQMTSMNGKNSFMHL